ncbi:MAG: SdrD B-like domain-containing protein [Arachnia sp.]
MKPIRLAMAATAAALLGAVGAFAPGVAHAENGTADDISSEIVQQVRVSTFDGGDQVRLWHSVKVDIELSTHGSASSAVDEGDTFSIGFPDELRIPNGTLALEGSGETLATCDSDGEANTLTCTLNAVAASKDFVEGAIQAEAQASIEGSLAQVVFAVGSSTTIEAAFPGGQILPGDNGQAPSQVMKNSWQGRNTDEIVWNVFVPADAVPAGTGISVIDRLQGDHTLSTSSEGSLRIFLYADDQAWASGTSNRLPEDQYSLTLDNDSKGYSLSFLNSDPGHDGVYQIQYRTQLPQGTTSGELFFNSADVNGTRAERQHTYSNRISGTLDGPGRGSLLVAKTVSGEGADRALDHQFSIEASWSDSDGDHTAVLSPIAGGISDTLSAIPTGTVVTLTERDDTVIDGVASYVPSFSSDSGAVTVAADGRSAQVTIQEREVISVRVDNAITVAPASVCVGDYVWHDVNSDGLQDETDAPLADVTLTLTGPDGQPVTDINNEPVGPTTTDNNGGYEFCHLPVLEAGESYTVTVTTPEGYEPTTAGAGEDAAKDSSTGSASSGDLTSDEASDMTLDFGFVLPSDDTPTPMPAPSDTVTSSPSATGTPNPSATVTSPVPTVVGLPSTGVV